jgi:4-oxalocrotonate tautomerase
MWKGVGQDKAKVIIEKITQVFEDIGIPARAVEVVVHETPKTHWGVGGEPASERLGDESPPG